MFLYLQVTLDMRVCCKYNKVNNYPVMMLIPVRLWLYFFQTTKKGKKREKGKGKKRQLVHIMTTNGLKTCIYQKNWQMCPMTIKYGMGSTMWGTCSRAEMGWGFSMTSIFDGNRERRDASSAEPGCWCCSCRMGKRNTGRVRARKQRKAPLTEGLISLRSPGKRRERTKARRFQETVTQTRENESARGSRGDRRRAREEDAVRCT